MKVFIDSTIFLKLLLDEPGASEAQSILEGVEAGDVLAYVTPLVLEEVSFKLLFAEASHRLNTSNIWKIKEALKNNREVRAHCMEVLERFTQYIEHLSVRGLRVEGVSHNDWLKSLNHVEKHGLLPADALHLTVAVRLGINTIASFDEDFKYIEGITVIPH